MQILAKVLHRLDKHSGTSAKGNAWASIEFVVEYDFDQKYPKRAVLQFFGVEQVDKAIQDLHLNTEAYFDFDIDARKVTTNSGKEKWYQSLRCYKYQLTTLNVQPSAPATQPAATPSSAMPAYQQDDLPF